MGHQGVRSGKGAPTFGAGEGFGVGSDVRLERVSSCELFTAYFTSILLVVCAGREWGELVNIERGREGVVE